MRSLKEGTQKFISIKATKKKNILFEYEKFNVVLVQSDRPLF